MIFLETERLLFRSHEAGDEADFVAMQTDLEVRRWVGGRAWSTEEAVRRFRRSFRGRPRELNRLCATVLKSEGRYIGYCGLRWRRGRGGAPPNKGELAYYLARPYWGRGLATEAGAAFLELGFETLGLKRVQASYEVGNEASKRVLDKLGFRYVSEKTIPPRHFHTCEITKAEWEERRSG
jgi:RimJ/RimL family protein N-acetyltransferase